MRELYIAGNWKMNYKPGEAAVFAKQIADAVKNLKVKVMIAPPFVCLPAVTEAVKGSNVIVAAQNVNDHASGAYTGEISCDMLKDIGVNTVIVGHSERRQYYGETNEFINKKVLFAIENEMDVILCVGETLEERDSGRLEKVLADQINIGLSGVSENQMEKITVAYEPVWAIGTGKTATPSDADSAHAYIRSLIAEKFGKTVAENTIIQYGGSVKPANAKELMACSNIDGALVGGASLTLEPFLSIINASKK
ncbi:MAG: triose-phosphate isomerase [Sphaerochaetaceae bacterium]|nr:triose-phosphate isomerase [Sphaerochaetaceae bacterium]